MSDHKGSSSDDEGSSSDNEGSSSDNEGSSSDDEGSSSDSSSDDDIVKALKKELAEAKTSLSAANKTIA